MNKGQLDKLVSHIVDYLANDKEQQYHLEGWAKTFFEEIELLAPKKETCGYCEKRAGAWVRHYEIPDEGKMEDVYCKSCLLEQGIGFLIEMQDEKLP